ncbi:MAG: GPW/gp25 family protein [Verrucomicrobia bacterium]|nr:GPW/gp25 family protein [Verrucomicrobiota bacterium]
MSFFNKFKKMSPPKSLQEDIFDSICDLLNTKVTFGAYQKDLGMETYVYLSSSSEISKQIIKDIRTCLEKYETRITITDVQPMPPKGDMYLGFMINCKIQKSSHTFQLAFQPQHKQFKRGGEP